MSILPNNCETTARAFAKDILTGQERKLGDPRRSDMVIAKTLTMPTRDWVSSALRLLQHLMRSQSFGVLEGVWSQG